MAIDDSTHKSTNSTDNEVSESEKDSEMDNGDKKRKSSTGKRRAPKSKRKPQTTTSKSTKGTESKAKSKPKNKLKKSLTQKVQQTNSKRLVLHLGKQDGFQFHFEPEHGTWKELNHSKLRTSSNSVSSNSLTEFVSNNVNSSKNELLELQDRNKKLEEENRLLKLKIEILMEMVI